MKHADRPVARFDFVNLVASFGGAATSTQPQPASHALAVQGAIRLGDAVLASSRALADEALRNKAVFSSEDLVEQGNTLPLVPLGVDPPGHTVYRKFLDPLFSPGRVAALDDDITARVNQFIDAFIDRGSCDFTAELAELFPPSVFLGLLGLPWEELDTLVSFRDGLLRPGDPSMAPHERSALQRETAQRVYAYFDAVLDERAASPRDDLLSRFASAQAGGQFRRDELLSMCFVLLTAGLDTVTDSLTCFFAFLAQHPAHRRRIADDPGIIPGAVEELLRWETPVPSVVRWARQDCVLGGEAVEAGHHVIVNLGAVNLDPAELQDPLTVRFDRDVNRHLAFGGGVHRCLGSHLARRELAIALREWHRRIPEYALSPGYEVRYLPPLRYVPDLKLSWPA
jgi:cytochrome P450